MWFPRFFVIKVHFGFFKLFFFFKIVSISTISISFIFYFIHILLRGRIGGMGYAYPLPFKVFKTKSLYSGTHYQNFQFPLWDLLYIICLLVCLKKIHIYSKKGSRDNQRLMVKKPLNSQRNP